MTVVNIEWSLQAEAFFNHKRIYFVGRHKRSRFKLGEKLSLNRNARIEPYTCVTKGNVLTSIGSFAFSNSVLSAGVDLSIGRYCSIGSLLKIVGFRHPVEWLSTSGFTYDRSWVMYQDFQQDHEVNYDFHPLPPTPEKNKIVVQDDVWIGENVTLSRGITLGTGCVVAMNATVTKDVPPYAIVGGVPAKVLKYRFPEPVIKRLLASQWWEYSPEVFSDASFTDPERALDMLDAKKADGIAKPFTPEPLIVTLDLPHEIAAFAI
jgi:acetyltransferase-like isoleucine patch superfamily enzyme